MKKNIILILGTCLVLSLLFIGYQIKLSMPKEYYLPSNDNIYRDYKNIKNTIADIDNIEYPLLVDITNFESYGRYISIMTKYDNQRFFYLFERKLGNYYNLIYRYEMAFIDNNIYYKQIDNFIFIFGYNQYAAQLSISIPNCHTYAGNEFTYQTSNIKIGILDNKDDVGPITIYDDQGKRLTEAKKCE